jgi:hypothetical protein
MKVDVLVVFLNFWMTASLWMEFWKIRERSPEGIHQIVDLFSFLISFVLKKEEQESSLDFVIVHD